MHTKGPWRFTEGGIIDTGKRFGRSDEYREIADVFGVDEFDTHTLAPPSREEAAANARLIAAAPAMLEALQLCEAVLAEHEQYDEGEPSRESEAAEAARDAIARTES